MFCYIPACSANLWILPLSIHLQFLWFFCPRLLHVVLMFSSIKDPYLFQTRTGTEPYLANQTLSWEFEHWHKDWERLALIVSHQWTVEGMSQFLFPRSTCRWQVDLMSCICPLRSHSLIVKWEMYIRIWSVTLYVFSEKEKWCIRCVYN